MGDAGDILLSVRELRTYFDTEQGVAKAVDGVSFDVRRGRTLALVGESGCGKSVTSMSIMRLVACPPGRIAGGEVLYDGRDLLKLPEREMRALRGNRIAMVFQEPMTSLNPVFTVGSQVAEALRLHRAMSRSEARAKTVDMLREVGIPSPETRVDEYPHQLSGGMKQRVMIAMALACGPELVIADEPTTALDVTIQAQILRLLARLQKEHGMSVLLITHDLGVVAENADGVCVMYASKIVEKAEAKDLFPLPLHPYTIGLFRSIPRRAGGAKRLATIPGSVPNPLDFPPGCKFHPRCFMAEARCKADEPPLREVKPGRWSACWFAERLHGFNRQDAETQRKAER